jgi:hypothetical protein
MNINKQTRSFKVFTSFLLANILFSPKFSASAMFEINKIEDIQLNFESSARYQISYSDSKRSNEEMSTSPNNDSINDEKDNKTLIYSSFIKPIPSWIGPTKFPGIDVFSPKNYDISMWGIGFGFQKNIYKDFSIFGDITRHSFKQELVKENGSANLASTVTGINYTVPFPLGVKYTALTTSIRLGVKYTYKKSEVFQPWIGVAYGINLWDVKYVSFDEEKVYGQASDNTFRHAVMAGIDIRMEDVGVITFFFDAVSPVAVFTMEDLFGLGDFYQFDATTYPTPRIGISIGIFN